MERWAKSVNAAKAVQQQQLQAAIKAEAQETVEMSEVTTSFPALSSVVPDVNSKGGIALVAALREVRDQLV